MQSGKLPELLVVREWDFAFVCQIVEIRMSRKSEYSRTKVTKQVSCVILKSEMREQVVLSKEFDEPVPTMRVSERRHGTTRARQLGVLKGI